MDKPMQLMLHLSDCMQTIGADDSEHDTNRLLPLFKNRRPEKREKRANDA
jgi:hypothetical protein